MNTNQPSTSKLKIVLLSLGLGAFGTLTGLGIGTYYVLQQSGVKEYIWPLVKVSLIINEAYIDPQNSEQTKNRLLTSLVDSLDPHSSYLGPTELEAMNKDMKAEYGGIGITGRIKDGKIEVEDILNKGPAYVSGLKIGDLIYAINGVPIDAKKLSQAFEKIRGPVDSSVALSIERKNQKLDLSVKRANIEVPTVQWSRFEAGKSLTTETQIPKSDDTLYLRLKGFNEKLIPELTETLTTQLELKKPDQIVIDLRDNPGGLVTAAVGLGAIFLPQEQVFVSAKERNREIVWKTSRDDYGVSLPDNKPDAIVQLQSKFPYLLDIPLYVLVNRNSASASELVSSAWQDYKRARVYGGATFGKGSVQTLMPLGDNDGAVKITTSRYYSPKGRSIQAQGVTPDVEVKTPSDKGMREADLPGHLPSQTSQERKGSSTMSRAMTEQMQEAEELEQSKLDPEKKTVSTFQKYLVWPTLDPVLTKLFSDISGSTDPKSKDLKVSKASEISSAISSSKAK